jgi:hypothetical protein
VLLTRPRCSITCVCRAVSRCLSSLCLGHCGSGCLLHRTTAWLSTAALPQQCLRCDDASCCCAVICRFMHICARTHMCVCVWVCGGEVDCKLCRLQRLKHCRNRTAVVCDTCIRTTPRAELLCLSRRLVRQFVRGCLPHNSCQGRNNYRRMCCCCSCCCCYNAHSTTATTPHIMTNTGCDCAASISTARLSASVQGVLCVQACMRIDTSS